MKLDLNRKISLVRFGGDYILPVEYQNDLQEIIEECEDIYPGIDVWYKNKVKSELLTKARTAYLVYENNKPIAASIIKKGINAKLCSMRVKEPEQNRGIGNLLMALLAKETDKSKTIHFTIPESLWFEKEKYFEKYNFHYLGLADKQYRNYDQELVCKVDSKSFSNYIMGQLPYIVDMFTINGNDMHCDLILSIKQKYAEKIKNRSKRVEIRRRFPQKWEGSSVMLYATEPSSEFFGEAIIERIIVGTPDKIWSEWGSLIGCEFEDYYSYTKKAKTVSALILDNISIYRVPILKKFLENKIHKTFNAPQSYCAVRENTIYPTAVMFSTLMQSTIAEPEEKVITE